VVNPDSSVAMDTGPSSVLGEQSWDEIDAGSLSANAVRSILVADCGSSFTRVSLLARTSQGFSFVGHAVAPTTMAPPWSDVSVGVRHCIEQLTGATGRALINKAGLLLMPETKSNGVDSFILVCSAGKPLRVVLAGLIDNISLASLERAAASSYTEVVGLIARNYVGPQFKYKYSLDGAGGANAGSDSAGTIEMGKSYSDEDRIALIRELHPDLVWIAGGTNGGSREPVRDLVETIALACTLSDHAPQPALVYAGNAELRSEIVELIGEEVRLQVIDNVRPALDQENLASAQHSFQSAYVERKVRDVPGIGDLVGWSAGPVLPTAQTLSYLALYLERLYESGKGVLCADVGSANTIVAASLPGRPSPEGDDLRTSGKNVQPVLQVASGLGAGYGAASLLQHAGVERIARWLPFEAEPGEIERVLLNKQLRPITVAQDRRELLIEQAAAREALRLVVQRARDTWYASGETTRPWLTPFLDPIVATGGLLSHAPRPCQTVLMLLDAIEPVGISTLVLDAHGMATSLGAVAVNHPLAAVQALDAGAFQSLATVVSPLGRARPGDVVMRVKVIFEGGGELEVEAKYGSLEVVPLGIGEKARLEFKLRRGIYVGQTRGPVEINGGTAGLVIDARGRPLHLPSDPGTCRDRVQNWLWDMGA
jgi:hypothetical protein